MHKYAFTEDETNLPVTMQQFETLTNEILTGINEITAPHALDADYTAQVLMSAIHAMDHKHGYVKKSELLESCINRISCHVTYHAVQEIQARLKAKQGLVTAEAQTNGDPTDNVIPIEQS